MSIVVAALVLPVAALAQPAANAADACRRADFRVFIDVGHSTDAPGALSARGVYEFDFNLGLANRIEHALLTAGFKRTVLAVTEGDARASLVTRVAHANRLGVDLFLSIHHDSVPEKFLQLWNYVGTERRFSDQFRGHSIFVSYDNRDRAGSLMFARLLGLQLKAGALHYTPHYTRADMGGRRRTLVDVEAGVYRFDRLRVLRGTTMPAVLLEGGSIINRDEEMEVVKPERQALIATAAAKAVEQFCAARAVEMSARRKQPRTVRTAERSRAATSASALSARVGPARAR